MHADMLMRSCNPERRKMEESVKVNGLDAAEKVESFELSAPPRKRTDTVGRSRRSTVVELILLGVVMSIIWVSLSLPILFFYLPVVSHVLGLCGVLCKAAAYLLHADGMVTIYGFRKPSTIAPWWVVLFAALLAWCNLCELVKSQARMDNVVLLACCTLQIDSLVSSGPGSQVSTYCDSRMLVCDLWD